MWPRQGSMSWHRPQGRRQAGSTRSTPCAEEPHPPRMVVEHTVQFIHDLQRVALCRALLLITSRPRTNITTCQIRLVASSDSSARIHPHIITQSWSSALARRTQYREFLFRITIVSVKLKLWLLFISWRIYTRLVTGDKCCGAVGHSAFFIGL